MARAAFLRGDPGLAWGARPCAPRRRGAPNRVMIELPIL